MNGLEQANQSTSVAVRPKTFTELRAEHAHQRAIVNGSCERGIRSHARKIRDTSRYQSFRESYQKRHPLCCDPLKLHPNETKQIQHVHHIIGVNVRPDLAFSESNCAPLCTKCHNTIEAMERHGKNTQYLFVNINKDVDVDVTI